MADMYGPRVPAAATAMVSPTVVLPIMMAMYAAASLGGISLCCNLKYSPCWRIELSVVFNELILASDVALVNWGITMAARMPRMITTIRISTKVKPRDLRMGNSPKKLRAARMPRGTPELGTNQSPEQKSFA